MFVDEFQSAMPKEGRASIHFPREWVLVIGVRNERGRWRRYFEHVGERKQNRMDQHEPQLGCFLPGICNSGWPISFFQGYFIHHQRDYYCMECCSFQLERWTNLFHQRQLPLKNICTTYVDTPFHCLLLCKLQHLFLLPPFSTLHVTKEVIVSAANGFSTSAASAYC